MSTGHLLSGRLLSGRLLAVEDELIVIGSRSGAWGGSGFRTVTLGAAGLRSCHLSTCWRATPSPAGMKE